MKTFEEFLVDFVPTATIQRRTKSFEDYARERGVDIERPDDLGLVIMGSAGGETTRTRGLRNSAMKRLEQTTALHQEYLRDVPAIEEQVVITNPTRAAAMARVAYRRFMRQEKTDEQEKDSDEYD